jgi:hypothetical protein
MLVLLLVTLGRGMIQSIRTILVLLSVLALVGCSSMQSHDKVASGVQAASRSGGFSAAIAELDKTANSEADRGALLYNLERGELLRLNKQYVESTDAFMKADTRVKEWEDTAKSNPSKFLGMVGASLISERLSAYEGQDYEKVWLTTRLALNRLAQGDLENARVDIKRTHEREAVILEFRAKEVAAAEEEAKEKGASAKGKELNGYPVETLNDPEVLKLKNGYQNALSHYLAGFLYEVLNEPGLAAPGYRKAIELKPETAVLEEGLSKLDDRTSFTHKRHQKMTDVLFVVEAGNAPARKPKAFAVPIPINGNLQAVSISYPIIEASNDPPLGSISAGGKQLNLESVVDLNVMARRALRDAMPGMVIRGVTRAIAKGVVQDQLAKHAGIFGSLVGAVAAIATEQADDRMWRMLPGRVYVARGYLPPGMHKLVINGREVGSEIKIDGQYAMVPIRIYEDKIVQGDVMAFGQIPATLPSVAAAKKGAENQVSESASAESSELVSATAKKVKKAKTAKKKVVAPVDPTAKPPAVASSSSVGTSNSTAAAH